MNYTELLRGGPTNLLAQHAICCQGADMMAFAVSEQHCQMCLAGIGLMSEKGGESEPIPRYERPCHALISNRSGTIQSWRECLGYFPSLTYSVWSRRSVLHSAVCSCLWVCAMMFIVMAVVDKYMIRIYYLSVMGMRL